MSPAQCPQELKELRLLMETQGMIIDLTNDTDVDDDNGDDEIGEASSVALGHSKETGSENDSESVDDDDEETETHRRCIHCQLDEDNDPASDFEEPLACVVCNAFSHRNCDRKANEVSGVKSVLDYKSSTWRCSTCAAANRLRSRSPRKLPEWLLARRKSPPKVEVSFRRGPNGVILHVEGLDPVKLARVFKTPSKPITTVKRRSTRSSNLGAKVDASALPAVLTDSTIYPIIPEDENPKPYGGILTEEESLTTETVPGTLERARFDAALKKAEDEHKIRTELTGSTKQPANGQRERDQAAEHFGGACLIECIHFGEYEIDTFHPSPYPEEYCRNKILWICEFCLKYMKSEFVCRRHKLKCAAKHPPGDEIYRDGSLSVFEIDGRKHRQYCRNLCLMAMLFLSCKTLYYEVHLFLFYVMTERDESGMHLVGYFSKEKEEDCPNNLSCIVTLPIHQRKGYGNLLIDFSYLLSRIEKRTGTPEKPFTDLGLLSYRNYWKLKLCYELRHQKDPITVNDISRRTGMTADDIICGLEALNALVRDPVTGYYALRLDHILFEALIERWEAKGYIKLNPDALCWVPYVTARSRAEYLSGVRLSAIPPRAGEQSKDDADGGKHSSEDPDSMNVDSAIGGFGTTNGALAAANSESGHRSSPSPGSPLQQQEPSHRMKPPHLPQPLVPSDIIATIREIPPTRFEIVPGPLGTRKCPIVHKDSSNGRGRPHLDSRAVQGLGKGDYGATPAMQRRGRGRKHQNERLVPEISPAPAITGTNRRIVAKGPRTRSRMAEVTRASRTSTTGRLLHQENGNSTNTASAPAAATSTMPASPPFSIASSRSSSSSSSDGN